MPRLSTRLTVGVIIFVLLVGLFTLGSSPSAAATTLLSVSGEISVPSEVDTFGIALTAGMEIQVEVVCGTPNTLDPMVELYDPANSYVTGDDDSGPLPCDGWWSSIFTYTVPVTGYYWLDVFSAFGNSGPYTLTVTQLNATSAGPAVFSGPGLPGTDGRNLVLFTRDTAVLNAPDGAPTGEQMKACQTAFVLATSEDGVWGRIFVMGGWVPLANTLDVPEDYGQNGENDAALVPGCVGVLPYPPVSAPPVLPTPTPTRPPFQGGGES